jgi:hypothetical protein
LFDQGSKLQHYVAAGVRGEFLPCWEGLFGGLYGSIDVCFAREVDIVCYEGAIFRIEKLKLLGIFGSYELWSC